MGLSVDLLYLAAGEQKNWVAGGHLCHLCQNFTHNFDPSHNRHFSPPLHYIHSTHLNSPHNSIVMFVNTILTVLTSVEMG